MKLKVEQDLCISCGLCINDLPDIFSWAGDKAVAKDVELNDELVKAGKEVLAICPTNAIKKI